jgi:hypothetical protein
MIASAAVIAGLAGCAQSSPSSDIDESEVKLVFHPSTGGRSTATRERVVLINTSDRDLELTDYRLKYDSGESYTFDKLELDPRGKVLVVSQGHGDGRGKSNPPVYVRNAGFESLVLSDGRAEISLVAPGGDIVVKRKYKDS